VQRLDVDSLAVSYHQVLAPAQGRRSLRSWAAGARTAVPLRPRHDRRWLVAPDRWCAKACPGSTPQALPTSSAGSSPPTQCGYCSTWSVRTGPRAGI